MSLIGKKVTYKKWEFVTDNVYGMSNFKSVLYNGIVLDKYNGLTEKSNIVASGLGGTINIDQRFNIDYYIIETEKDLEHIPCNDIININK